MSLYTIFGICDIVKCNGHPLIATRDAVRQNIGYRLLDSVSAVNRVANNRINKYTPAVTRVNECTKAETVSLALILLSFIFLVGSYNLINFYYFQ